MDGKPCSNLPKEGDQTLCRYWWNHQVTNRCIQLVEEKKNELEKVG